MLHEASRASRRPRRPARRLGRALRRFRRDRDAQMMLLTAFVLVIGFVALAGMVARVNQLPEATRQAGDRPIYTEAASVARGIEEAMERINDMVAPANATDMNDKDLLGHVEQALKHMERLESAQGFRLRIDSVVCDASGGSAELVATYALADTSTRIGFETRHEVVDPMDIPIPSC